VLGITNPRKVVVKMKRTMKLEVAVDVVKDKKTKNGGSYAVRFDVEGMMAIIKRSMPDKNKQDLLDEYAKLYVMKQLGIKVYPLEK
jgi:hypothetical protein